MTKPLVSKHAATVEKQEILILFTHVHCDCNVLYTTIYAQLEIIVMTVLFYIQQHMLGRAKADPEGSRG